MLADARTVDTVERYSKPLAAALAVSQPLPAGNQVLTLISSCCLPAQQLALVACCKGCTHAADVCLPLRTC